MILVTGATGTVGRNVVAQLVAEGRAVRALSRRPASATPPAGVEVVAGDLTRPESLVPALAGVDTVFLFPVAATAVETAEVIRSAGVRRVVVLSSAAVAWTDEQQPELLAQSHRQVERAVENSGLAWTFLRPSVFAANSLTWVPEIRSGGPVHLPYPQASVSAIHEYDIAAVAVRAITEDGHDGAQYLLTGPESVTMAEQVEIIAGAIGRPIPMQVVTPEAARAAMADQVPGPVADSLLRMLAAAVGRPASVTDTVEQVTGKPARTFPQWAADHVADFR